jgi:hypothetical protein
VGPDVIGFMNSIIHHLLQLKNLCKLHHHHSVVSPILGRKRRRTNFNKNKPLKILRKKILREKKELSR